MQKYSIIIPVLNEKNNIDLLIEKISKSLTNSRYEIIIIDDNSDDGSKEILNKIKKIKKNFSFYIRKKDKKDLSQSVILGIRKSKYKNIIVMDGDLQHDPIYLPILIKNFEKKKLELLVATRNFQKRNGLSFLRFYASKLLILFINLVFKKKTSDPMSGFFVLKKDIFKKNEKNLYGKGFKILFDVIYSSKINKISDMQIRFKSRFRNKSKMTLKVLIHLIKLFIHKLFNF